MAGKTLQQIQTMIRRRLGWPTADDVVSDAELKDMIRESQREALDFLVATFGDEYGVATTTVTTSAGVDTYSITNAIRVHRVSVRFEGKSVPFRRRQPQSDVVDHTAQAWNLGTDLSYRLVRASDFSFNNTLALYVHPVPNAAYIMRVMRTSDAGTFSLSTAINPIGYDEMIVLDVMAKLRIMEEQDASDIIGKLERFKAQIQADAAPLDLGQPQVINDARSAGYPRDGR